MVGSTITRASPAWDLDTDEFAKALGPFTDEELALLNDEDLDAPPTEAELARLGPNFAQRVLRRAMRKRVSQRLQDAADLAAPITDTTTREVMIGLRLLTTLREIECEFEVPLSYPRANDAESTQRLWKKLALAESMLDAYLIKFRSASAELSSASGTSSLTAEGTSAPAAATRAEASTPGRVG